MLKVTPLVLQLNNTSGTIKDMKKKVPLQDLYKKLKTQKAVSDVVGCGVTNIAKHLRQIDAGKSQVFVEIDSDGKFVGGEIVRPFIKWPPEKLDKAS